MALVTYESVAGAAEAIQQAGGKPSVRSVISQLGGGSPNAVGPLLGEAVAFLSPRRSRGWCVHLWLGKRLPSVALPRAFLGILRNS